MEVKKEPFSSRKVQKADRENIYRGKLNQQFLSSELQLVYISRRRAERFFKFIHSFSYIDTNGLLQIQIGLRVTKVQFS